jgi:hypothetical protein
MVKACAKGGKTDIDTGEDGETPDEPLKKGGKVMKAHGEMPKKRADKRARGGKVGSPSHPLSGAAPKTQRPGFSEKQKIGKESN